MSLIIELEPIPPLKKKTVFWSNPYKTEVIITSLAEMLKLPKYGHMTTFTLQFESHDKIVLLTSWAEIIPL